MRQHSGALERKWNRQFTRPIFPAGAKNVVWERDYISTDHLVKISYDISVLSNHSIPPYHYSTSCTDHLGSISKRKLYVKGMGGGGGGGLGHDVKIAVA